MLQIRNLISCYGKTPLATVDTTAGSDPLASTVIVLLLSFQFQFSSEFSVADVDLSVFNSLESIFKNLGVDCSLKNQYKIQNLLSNHRHISQSL